MPYVEYSVDQDDAKSPQTPTASKNVAKKSTALRPSSHNEIISEKPTGPPKPNEKVEYTSKGYIRTMQLSSRIPGRIFVPHQCGLCTNWNTLLAADLKGINPLAVPLIFGFERFTCNYLQ